MSLKTFKSQLKAKLKTLGVNNLSNERIDAYAATLHKRNPDLTDDQAKEHDDKIDELNEVIDFKKVAADDDRVRTLETKLKEKDKSSTKKEDDDEEEEDDEDTPPASGSGKKKPRESVSKKILEKLESLSGEVLSLKKEKQVATIKDKIKGHEKMKDIPEDFYEEWRQPDKEEDIDAFAEKVATKYSTYKQIEKNTKATSSTKPPNAQGDTKGQADIKEVDKILDNIMPGTKAPVETK